MIVGAVDDVTGAVTVDDRYSRDEVTPTRDAQQDLLDAEGFQTATATVVSFKRLLNTGDTVADKPIVPGLMTVVSAGVAVLIFARFC